MNCPRCDLALEYEPPIAGEHAPGLEAGERTMCLGCGALLVFDVGVRIREATGAEIREELASVYGPRIVQAREILARYRRVA